VWWHTNDHILHKGKGKKGKRPSRGAAAKAGGGKKTETGKGKKVNMQPENSQQNKRGERNRKGKIGYGPKWPKFLGQDMHAGGKKRGTQRKGSVKKKGSTKERRKPYGETVNTEKELTQENSLGRGGGGGI